MKHMDFSKTLIIDPSEDVTTSSYHVVRIAEDTEICELCAGPAEYRVRSQFDSHGMCDLFECQTCLISEVTSVMSSVHFLVTEGVQVAWRTV